MGSAARRERRRWCRQPAAPGQVRDSGLRHAGRLVRSDCIIAQVGHSPMIHQWDAQTAPGLFTRRVPPRHDCRQAARSPAVQRTEAVGPQIIVLPTDGDPNTCGGMTSSPAAMTNYQPRSMPATSSRPGTAHVRDQRRRRRWEGHFRQMANIGPRPRAAASPGAMVISRSRGLSSDARDVDRQGAAVRRGAHRSWCEDGSECKGR